MRKKIDIQKWFLLILLVWGCFATASWTLEKSHYQEERAHERLVDFHYTLIILYQNLRELHELIEFARSHDLSEHDQELLAMTAQHVVNGVNRVETSIRSIEARSATGSKDFYMNEWSGATHISGDKIKKYLIDQPLQQEKLNSFREMLESIFPKMEDLLFNTPGEEFGTPAYQKKLKDLLNFVNTSLEQL